MGLNLSHSMNETPTDPDKGATLDDQTTAIRHLNDALRQTFEGGQVLMTPGVTGLASQTLARVLVAVRDFDDFSEDNDPFQTHEFGMVDVDGEHVMFKVDAYDENMEYGSPNPADPEVTRRVMTILLASEY